MIKIFGVRSSLLGDIVMSLPMLEYLKLKFPDSYIYFQIAKKCSQGQNLFNHRLIDEIVISDCEEGMGPRDIEIAKGCDIVIDTTPQHPEGERWHSQYTCVEETVRMTFGNWCRDLGIKTPDDLLADFKKMDESLQKPKLYPIDTFKDYFIALWPCAGYGKWNVRNPDQAFYQKLIDEIEKRGEHVAVFGHPDDFELKSAYNFKHLSFADQIKMTLDSKIMIGTDSGSSWITGAFSHPQINLLTNWYPYHKKDFWPLAPENWAGNNIDICVEGWENLKIEMVLEKLWNKIK